MDADTTLALAWRPTWAFARHAARDVQQQMSDSGRALTARTTGTRARRVTRVEAAGCALGLAGLVVFVWMPSLGSVLVVGGVVLFIVGRFR